MTSLYAVVPLLRNAELQFWTRVARLISLNARGDLFITGRGVGKSDYCKGGPVFLPYYMQTSSCNYSLENDEAAQCLYRQISNQADLWGEPYSYDDFLKEASIISLHLSVIKPLAVLIWNWHRPEGFLTRIIAESKGISCWDIERTPWPGMLSLDRNGQLSETNLGISLATFSGKHKDCNVSTEDCIDRYRQRGMEYFSRVMEESWTWWQQPNPRNSIAAKIARNSDYCEAKHRVLFAGQVDNDVQNFLFNPRYNSNAEAFEAFIQALPNDTFVIGKHHPLAKSSISDYQEIIDKAEHVTGLWTAELDVETAMTLAEHVAAVNSSILFEAMFHGKSCFEMGQTMLSKLDVFYDCKLDDELSDAIEEWLSESEEDCSKRFRRFLVLTGFALSHGLLAFEDFSLSFDEPDADVFMGKWLNRLSIGQESRSNFSVSDCLSIEFSNLVNPLAALGLCHKEATISNLRKELGNSNSLSVKKAAIALLLSLKASFKRRMTVIAARLPRLSHYKKVQVS